MTEPGFLQLFNLMENSIRQLEDRVENCLAHSHSMEIDMARWMEQNPKSSDQWTKERLRALEHKIGVIETTMKAIEQRTFDLLVKVSVKE